MKYLLTLTFFFSTCLLIAQTSIYLSDAIPLVEETGFGNRSPRIVTLEDGRPVVYWGKPGNNSKLYIATWQDDGFGEPVTIDTDGIEVDIWQSGLGPQLAAQGNTIFLVFEAYNVGIYSVRSTDGGLSFDAPVSVFDFPPGRVATLPSVTINSNGNPIISFVTTNFQEEEAQYEVSISLDGGATFEPTVVANTEASGGEVCECCPATLSVTDDDELLLTFRNNDANIRDIWVSKSDANTLDFTIATDIDDTDWFITGCPSSGPDAFVVGDSLVAVASSGIPDAPGVYLSTMNATNMDMGYQFKFPTFNGNAVVQNYPRISGHLDTIGVVYQEPGNIGTDVILSWSVTGTGDMAQQLVQVTEEVLSQNYPDIAFSNGVFHIVYADQSTGKVMYKQAGFSPFTHTQETAKPNLNIQANPNPFDDYTQIDLSEFGVQNWDIQLVDLKGQEIRKYQTSEAFVRIEKKNLEAGIYFLNLKGNKKWGRIKLVIL